jgi:hypothetical protein
MHCRRLKEGSISFISEIIQFYEGKIHLETVLNKFG